MPHLQVKVGPSQDQLLTPFHECVYHECVHGCSSSHSQRIKQGLLLHFLRRQKERKYTHFTKQFPGQRPRDVPLKHMLHIQFLLARGCPGGTETTHCNAHWDSLASWLEEQQWYYLLPLCIPVFGVKVAVCPWGLQKLGSDPVLWSLRLPSSSLFLKCAVKRLSQRRTKEKLLCCLLPTNHT